MSSRMLCLKKSLSKLFNSFYIDYSQMDYRILISYRVNVTLQYERSFMRTTTPLTRVVT